MIDTASLAATLGLADHQVGLIWNIFNEVIPPSIKFELWIFGSRATGHFRQFSDIDLLLKFLTPCAAKSKYKDRICEQLEQSDLPYKVDLVTDEELAFAYRESVERSKILLGKRI